MFSTNPRCLELTAVIEKALEGYFQNHTLRDMDPGESQLLESMRYSALSGGKRLRPLLFLFLSEAFGVERQRALPFALALEMIHNYSLIHDDLPAMDDDRLRRGRPCNHIVYGEGTAILAGDALLNEAFELMLNHLEGPADVACARVIGRMAGREGMIGGQAIDLYYTNRNDAEPPEKEADILQRMQEMKTSALFVAACEGPARLAALSEEQCLSARALALSLGRAFQLRDDYLDVCGSSELLGKNVGQDAKEHKLTGMALYDPASLLKRLAEEEAEGLKLIELLPLNAADRQFLTELLQALSTRNH